MVKLPNEVVEITNWGAPMPQNTFGWRWLHVEDFWTPPSPWRQLREYLALAQDVRIVTPGTRWENIFPWCQFGEFIYPVAPTEKIIISGASWENVYPWRQLRVCLSLAPAESSLSISTLSAVAACQASYPHTHTSLYTISTSFYLTYSRIFIN